MKPPRFRRRPHQFWVGDSLVIGGGITGVLTALDLKSSGVETTLVESEGLGNDQSNHSHGYIHRGYIYRSPDPRLISAFGRARSRWDFIVERGSISPATNLGQICFTNRWNADAAVAAWKTTDLRVDSRSEAVGISPGVATAIYRTDEPSFDLTKIFEHLRDQLRLQDVHTFRGRVLRLVRDKRGHICGVVADTAVGRVELRARVVVLAAGTGNADLVSSVTKFLGRAVTRTSYMLVLRSKDLPMVSAVFPESEMYGLFLVSRQLTEGNAWLASTFVSYSGDLNDNHLESLWGQATYRKLLRACPAVEAGHIGVYAARKTELRPSPREMSTHAIESYGFPNLLVLAPTKLTLAPLLAEEARGRAIEFLTHTKTRTRSIEPFPRSDVLPIVPERWRSIKTITTREYVRASAI